jgi:drug/metabolite transporter (DMT)-like permease
MAIGRNRILKWIYLALLAAIWGSSFILMKRGITVFTPNQVAALRMLVSLLALLPFTISKLKTIPKEKLKYVFWAGMLGNGIPAYLFTNAETGISSSMAGMLNSLTSVFTLVIGFLFFKTQFKFRQIAGVALGLAGAAFLIYLSAGDAKSTEPSKGFYVLIATVFYAFAVNILRNKLNTIDTLLLSCAVLVSVGIPSGIYLFSTDFVHRLTTSPGATHAFICVLILGVMGTALSTIIFNQLIRISSALYASSVTYLIPFVAVMWGLYDGETFNLLYLFALTIIIAGIYLINFKPKEKFSK